MDFFLGLIVGAGATGAFALLLFGDREQDMIDEPTTASDGDTDTVVIDPEPDQTLNTRS